jgi:hypothetical protein
MSIDKLSVTADQKKQKAFEKKFLPQRLKEPYILILRALLKRHLLSLVYV